MTFFSLFFLSILRKQLCILYRIRFMVEIRRNSRGNQFIIACTRAHASNVRVSGSEINSNIIVLFTQRSSDNVARCTMSVLYGDRARVDDWSDIVVVFGLLMPPPCLINHSISVQRKKVIVFCFLQKLLLSLTRNFTSAKAAASSAICTRVGKLQAETQNFMQGRDSAMRLIFNPIFFSLL